MSPRLAPALFLLLVGVLPVLSQAMTHSYAFRSGQGDNIFQGNLPVRRGRHARYMAHQHPHQEGPSFGYEKLEYLLAHVLLGTGPLVLGTIGNDLWRRLHQGSTSTSPSTFPPLPSFIEDEEDEEEEEGVCYDEQESAALKEQEREELFWSTGECPAYEIDPTLAQDKPGLRQTTAHVVRGMIA